MSQIATLDEDFVSSPDGKFLSWAHAQYEREIELQYESRSLRARDADFYDGEQYTAEEIAEYESRGQKARVFNEAKPTIDWILGGESRARLDWRVLPRSEDDVEPAIRKTKLVKYLDDINKAKWQRSQAFKDMVVTGKGWMRVCMQPNPEGDYEVTLKWEHWLNMVDDSSARQPDMSDMRYLWCSKVLDVETPAAWFPAKKAALTAEAGCFEQLTDEQTWDGIDRELRKTDGWGNAVRHGSMTLGGGSYAGDRKAVRVWEMWYRKTEEVQVLRGTGRFNGELYDENSQDHQEAVTSGAYQVRKTVREQMYMAMYTKTTVLFHGKSAYRHNRFPFVQRVAYIKDKDGTVYGPMRPICDPQSDLNARRNHALFLMATTSVVMDEGAVDNIRKLEAEVGRSDSIIEKKKGFDFNMQRGGVLAPQHLDMAAQDSAYIRQISGVTGENRGLDTNATSGIAIQARQEQGTVITSILADRHSLARQIEGELCLSLIEQFMDQERQFRITGDKLKHEFVKINDGSPETDITATQADFVVGEQDYRQTMRQALAEQIINVAGTISQHTGNPNMAVALLEMAIELQDIPNKDELTARLREAAGLPPKDESDEQKQAREAQQSQAQAQQQQQQQAIQELAMRESAAKSAEMEARTQKTQADTRLQEVNAATAKLAALKQSIETAHLANMAPDALTLADELIKDADGILGLNQQDEAEPPPNMPAPTQKKPTQTEAPQ